MTARQRRMLTSCLARRRAIRRTACQRSRCRQLRHQSRPCRRCLLRGHRRRRLSRATSAWQMAPRRARAESRSCTTACGAPSRATVLGGRFSRRTSYVLSSASATRSATGDTTRPTAKAVGRSGWTTCGARALSQASRAARSRAGASWPPRITTTTLRSRAVTSHHRHLRHQHHHRRRRRRVHHRPFPACRAHRCHRQCRQPLRSHRLRHRSCRCRPHRHPLRQPPSLPTACRSAAFCTPRSTKRHQISRLHPASLAIGSCHRDGSLRRIRWRRASPHTLAGGAHTWSCLPMGQVGVR